MRSGHFFMACRKKGPLACHAERERSIWSHQAGGVAHLGFFAALRMTCPGHFFMACHDKCPLPCHAERERSIWFHQPGGMAHLGFFAALRMTCPGHFVMACRMLAPSSQLAAQAAPGQPPGDGLRTIFFRPPQASRQGWPYSIRGGRAAGGAVVSRRASPGGWPASRSHGLQVTLIRGGPTLHEPYKCPL